MIRQPFAERHLCAFEAKGHLKTIFRMKGKREKWDLVVLLIEKSIRVADAKEVGVENPAEETYRHPNQIHPQDRIMARIVNA